MQPMSRRECLAALLGMPLAAIASTASVASGPRAPLRDPDHVFSIYAWSWQELKRRNVVMQNYDYSCGAAALATILRYYWNDPATEKQIISILFKILTPDEIRDRVKHGLAISDLRQASVEMGYLASIGNLSFDRLAQSKIPLIVPIRLDDYDHFVVYRGMAGGRVYLADPVRGNVRPTVQEFCCQWKKNVILVVVKKNVTPPAQSALSIRPCEVYAGQTTEQWMREELPRPLPLPPALPAKIH